MTTFTEDAIEAMSKGISEAGWRATTEQKAAVALAAFRRVAADRGLKLTGREATDGMIGMAGELIAAPRLATDADRACASDCWAWMHKYAPDLMEPTP